MSSAWLQWRLERWLQRALRWADLWLFLRIYGFAAIVPLLMRFPLPQVERWLNPRRPALLMEPAQAAKIIRYTDRALRWGRPLLQVKCLTRGITLYYFLRRRGIAVALCFGVEEFEGKLAGHCWLVKDGVPFGEPQDPRLLYTPIYQMPSQP